MRRYPAIQVPDIYLDRLFRAGFLHSKTWLERGVILCDYCVQEYMATVTPRSQGISGGWLTDERCPRHRHFWLKLWFLT